MTYSEDVADRVQKIVEEIAVEWADHRMAEGKGYTEVGTDRELKAQRAELIDDIAYKINSIEAIDHELKLRADAKAEKEAADEAALQKRINDSFQTLGQRIKQNLDASYYASWRSPYWRDEIQSFSTKTPTRTSLYSRYYQ